MPWVLKMGKGRTKGKMIKLIALLLLILSPQVGAQGFEWVDEHLPIDQYMQMVDEEGNVLMESSRLIEEGDQYLTADNYLYEVVSIEGNLAKAKLKERVELPDKRFRLGGLTGLETQAGPREIRGIAFYHTHNAESYLPSDGTHSINGQGGIHKVGQAFAKALAELNVPVYYDETLHLPHDRGAYRRSRGTAMALLEENPDAIFDIHRDAAPAHRYALEIDDDEWVTSIQLVVGRQNQNFAINKEYAQSLKKIADTMHPGLIRGIFFGRGNYNQDLTPLNLLLEVGSHTNSREAAEKGIGYFAQVVDYYFYGPQEDRRTADPRGGLRGLVANRTALSILLVLFFGWLTYFVINSGSWQGALNRLGRLLGRLPPDGDDN
jgi:stage II sporulation protein P